MAEEGGRQHAADGHGKTQLKVTLWANGFQVDDGDFRDYNEPSNQQFMKELKQGFVPKELREKYKDQGVDVGLEDKRSQ